MNRFSSVIVFILIIVGFVAMPFLANYKATKELQQAGYTVKDTNLQYFQMSCFRDKGRLKVNFIAEEGKGYICLTVPYDLIGSKIHLEK